VPRGVSEWKAIREVIAQLAHASNMTNQLFACGFSEVKVSQNAVAAAGLRQIHSLVRETQQFGGIIICRSLRCHTHADCHLDSASSYFEGFSRYIAAQSLRCFKSSRHVCLRKSDREFFAAQPTE
jgi:hypothetical protein